MTNESKHNQVVRREARRLQRGGWNVRADISGYEQPAPIGAENRIPDVQATKHGHTKLIEVETRKSVKSDRAQQSTFRRSAAQRNNTTFDIVETG